MSMTTVFLIRCEDCDDGEHDGDQPVQRFESAYDRGMWAYLHRQETGHSKWWARDVRRPEELM